MRVNYYPDTDSLYIDLSLVGIDIDNASRKVQLDRLVLNSKLPSVIERVAG